MASIIEKKFYNVTCDCGKTVTVNNPNNIKKGEAEGWRIHKASFRFDKDEVMCPDCIEKERLRKYNSSDIRERIVGGYYKDHTVEFKVDAFGYVNVPLDHPKAKMLWEMAYEKGNADYYNVLNELEDLAKLIV